MPIESTRLPHESMTGYHVRLANESAERMLAEINADGAVTTDRIANTGVTTADLGAILNGSNNLGSTMGPYLRVGSTDLPIACGDPGVIIPAVSVSRPAERPHVCPKCDGEKQLITGSMGRPCPTCDGAGVLWR